jgi:hypothetical protein
MPLVLGRRRSQCLPLCLLPDSSLGEDAGSQNTRSRCRCQIPAHQVLLSSMGRDVTKAIETFEGCCYRRGLVELEMFCALFSDYCDEDIRWWVKESPSWLNNDWEGFKREILDAYKDEDSEHQQYSRSALLELVRQPRTTDGEVRRYVSRFTAIARFHLDEGLLLEWQCAEWLLAGLPEWLRQRVMKKEDICFEGYAMIRRSRPIRLAWVAKAVLDALASL